MVDVRELKETYPDSALVLDVDKNETPNLSSLSYKKVPVTEIAVGSFVLVQAGEVCQRCIYYGFVWSHVKCCAYCFSMRWL